MIKARETKGPAATDLLVCFPTRAHLSLMAPKPTCSPVRPSESSTRHHRRPVRKRGGHASPWAKHKSEDISEPTSPKVTCAGQIKVRTKPGSCKNWQSVMEEIERLHKTKKRGSWIEALGFKKEVTQFLTCLRNLRFDFRCFGSVPGSGITSDEDDDEDEEDDRNGDEDDDDQNSRAVFSKWFMILQEDNVSIKNEEKAVAEAAPPCNALLLMRCRSAPAKSWLEEREEDERRGKEGDQNEKLEFSRFSGVTSPTVIVPGEFSATKIPVMEEIQEKILRSRSWKR